MLKITRSSNSGTTTLALTGRVDVTHLPEVRRVVDAERGQGIVLDLREVNLVDLEVVRFLIECEAKGIRVVHCPAYVQEWMVREKRPP